MIAVKIHIMNKRSTKKYRLKSLRTRETTMFYYQEEKLSYLRLFRTKDWAWETFHPNFQAIQTNISQIPVPIPDVTEIFPVFVTK